MKRILSFVLVLATLLSVAVLSTSAATSGVKYYFSEKPYEDVNPINGRVIGYMGDTDGDGSVSVMDATEIQMWAAQLVTLSDDAKELADVDMDASVSVMDATEIQMWAAKLVESYVITYTLYTEAPSDSASTTFDFDKTVAYVIANGDYDEEYGDYSFTYYLNEDDYLDSLYFIWDPSDNSLYIGMHTSDYETLSMESTSVIIYEDEVEDEFFFSSDKVTFADFESEAVCEYDVYGYAFITGEKNFEFAIDNTSIENREDATYTYDQVSDTIIENVRLLFALTDDAVNS